MTASATCTAIPVQRTTINMARMMGLTTAAQLLGGQDKLADALGIQTRSLRSKFTAERGVSDVDLRFAAKALEAHAERIVEHARKLREEAGE